MNIDHIAVGDTVQTQEDGKGRVENVYPDGCYVKLADGETPYYKWYEVELVSRAEKREDTMMNRLPKYRAWHKQVQKMYRVIAVYLYDNKQEVSLANKSGMFLRTCSLDEVELLQFTGLLDKSGKEIYEGDILLIGNSAEERYYPNVQVRWKFNRWVFGTTCDWEFQERYIEEGKVEIIGNIYENSDLLSTDTN